MKKIYLSLVVPLFNEEKIIAKSLLVLNSYLDKNYPGKYELIFVNDGSQDKSLEIVEKEIKKYPRSRLISYRQNRVTQGFKAARGEIIGFIDSDLEIHPKYIKKCVDEIKRNDIAVISKYVKGSNIKTTLLRKITSKIFNLWVGFILDRDLADHQGGLKLAKGSVVRKILPKVKSHGWLFDLEFLYYAKKEGFKVSKVPVDISYGFRRVRASLGFDFLKSFLLVFKLKFNKTHNDRLISLFVFLFLSVLTIFVYRDLPKTFFQQDEWQFFGADNGKRQIG